MYTDLKQSLAHAWTSNHNSNITRFGSGIKMAFYYIKKRKEWVLIYLHEFLHAVCADTLQQTACGQLCSVVPRIISEHLPVSNQLWQTKYLLRVYAAWFDLSVDFQLQRKLHSIKISCLNSWMVTITAEKLWRLTGTASFEFQVVHCICDHVLHTIKLIKKLVTILAVCVCSGMLTVCSLERSHTLAWQLK